MQTESPWCGFYIGNTVLGLFGYADDIILIYPTMRVLKIMLGIAQCYSDSFDIKFTIGKREVVNYDKEGW